MADPNISDQLRTLGAWLQTMPVEPAGGDTATEDPEEIKRILDDMRLTLWGRLRASHASDARAFEEQFRARRALELCTRLSTDLKLGIVDPRHKEFGDLWIAAVELGQSIQAARARQSAEAGG
jgi:hypothetical protein